MTSFKHNWGSSNEIDRKKSGGWGKWVCKESAYTQIVLFFSFLRETTQFQWPSHEKLIVIGSRSPLSWSGCGGAKSRARWNVWSRSRFDIVWSFFKFELKERKFKKKKKKKIQQSLNNSSTIDRLNPVDGDLSISFSPSLIMSSPPKKWFLFKTKKTYSNYFFFRVFWSCVFIVYSSQSIARARVCECVCLCV